MKGWKVVMGKRGEKGKIINRVEKEMQYYLFPCPFFTLSPFSPFPFPFYAPFLPY
jgi:hypothetical protein